MKRNYTLKQRIQYWFDEQISAGTARMIRALAFVSLLMIFLLALCAILFSKNDFFGYLWDSFTYMINASIPSVEDGGNDYVYILLMSIAGLIGLLLTSVLIGILTTGVEEKLNQLRQGTSLVLENDHTVILGFNPGAYELIRELCLATPGIKRSILVAGTEDKTVMENLLLENVDIPDEVKLICRSIDLTSIPALSCCSIPFCKNVIINEQDDIMSIKILLAVTALLRNYPEAHVQVATFISHERNLIPAYVAGDQQVIVLPMQDITARLIAHTCTQIGIAEVFQELLTFEGADLYFSAIPQLIGRTFEECSLMLDQATPIGILHSGKTFLNPKGSTVLAQDDQLIFLADTKDSATLLSQPLYSTADVPDPLPKDTDGYILIIGCNSLLPDITSELEEITSHLLLANITDDMWIELSQFPHVERIEDAQLQGKQLERLLDQVNHVILLRDEALDKNAADDIVMLFLLRLRELRSRTGLRFKLTAEMNLEQNKTLVQNEEYADFIIASDISSMMMAQIAENPALFPIFRELLSNQGNELYLVPARTLTRSKEVLRHADLRARAAQRDAIYLGYACYDETAGLNVVLNPPLTETITLHRQDGIILLAEDLKQFSISSKTL